MNNVNNNYIAIDQAYDFLAETFLQSKTESLDNLISVANENINLKQKLDQESLVTKIFKKILQSSNPHNFDKLSILLKEEHNKKLACLIKEFLFFREQNYNLEIMTIRLEKVCNYTFDNNNKGSFFYDELYKTFVELFVKTIPNFEEKAKQCIIPIKTISKFKEVILPISENLKIDVSFDIKMDTEYDNLTSYLFRIYELKYQLSSDNNLSTIRSWIQNHCSTYDLAGFENWLQQKIQNGTSISTRLPSFNITLCDFIYYNYKKELKKFAPEKNTI